MSCYNLQFSEAIYQWKTMCINNRLKLWVNVGNYEEIWLLRVTLCPSSLSSHTHTHTHTQRHMKIWVSSIYDTSLPTKISWDISVVLIEMFSWAGELLFNLDRQSAIDDAFLKTMAPITLLCWHQGYHPVIKFFYNWI